MTIFRNLFKFTVCISELQLLIERYIALGEVKLIYDSQRTQQHVYSWERSNSKYLHVNPLEHGIH